MLTKSINQLFRQKCWNYTIPTEIDHAHIATSHYFHTRTHIRNGFKAVGREGPLNADFQHPIELNLFTYCLPGGSRRWDGGGKTYIKHTRKTQPKCAAHSFTHTHTHTDVTHSPQNKLSSFIKVCARRARPLGVHQLL